MEAEIKNAVPVLVNEKCHTPVKPGKVCVGLVSWKLQNADSIKGCLRKWRDIHVSENPKVSLSVLPELILRVITDNTELTILCVCGHKIVLNSIWKDKRARVKPFLRD